ncbi:MAG: hypothetical protein JRI68_21990 [Deltaproteobacteria bacterium]|nr:hypothetical protein [Deltaproteobacteria bacterium]
MWEALIVVAVVVAAAAVVIRRARGALSAAPNQPAPGCAGCAERAGCCAAVPTGLQRGRPEGTEERGA